MYKDSENKIWIGTKEGINLHTGLEIENIFPTNFLQREINSIIQVENEIWIATSGNGIEIYDLNGNFQRKILPINNTEILRLYKDENKNVWFSCKDGNIGRFDDKNIPRKIFFEELKNKVVYAFLNYNDQLLLGTDDGLFIVDQKTNQLVKESVFNKITPEHTYIYDFLENDEGIWIATYNYGLILYDGVKTKNYSSHNGLESNMLYCLFEDKHENLWIGSDGHGVFKYNHGIIEIIDKTSGLEAGEVVMSIGQDLKGNVLLGTLDGKIYMYKNHEIHDYFQLCPSCNYEINSITSDLDGQVWVSANEGGVYILKDQKIAKHFSAKDLGTSKILTIYRDKTNSMWLAGFGPVVKYENQKFSIQQPLKKIQNHRVISILEDDKSNIWFATDNGVFIYKDSTVEQKNTKDGISSVSITCLAQDLNGNMWIGGDKGISLIRYDTIINYSSKDGISTNNIYSMFFDEKGNLFLGTGKGIDIITFDWDYSIKNIRNMGVEDGIKGLECNTNALFQDKDKNLWFGTVQGAIKYKYYLENTVDKAPDVSISKIKLFFKDQNWEKENKEKWLSTPTSLVLNHTENHITFVLSANDAFNASKVKYSYIIEGLDTRWSPYSFQNEIVLSNTPPGKYTLKINACNNRGVCTEKPFEYTFIITPPFWKRPWFIALITLILLYLVYKFFGYRANQLKRANKLLEEKVIQRTEQLVEKKTQLENLTVAIQETSDGIVITDEKGNLEWMNKGMEELAGYTFEEVKEHFGKNITEVSTYPQIKEVLESFKNGARQSCTYESKHIHNSGLKLWTNANMTPIYDDEGSLKKIIIIYTNITAIKNSEQEILQKNKDITDNIKYARKIQDAIFPRKEILFQTVPQSFIYYKPKDIVSGDFYWFKKAHGKLILAAADCTGHGVHAAFLSMIGNEYLHQIINNEHIPDPHQTLEILDQKITESLKLVESTKETKDGLDIALCYLDLETLKLQYAGARRHIYLFHNGKLTNIQAQKFSIGGYFNKEKMFYTREIQLYKKDRVYLFSDGFHDQFGGKLNKKYSVKRFKKMLHDIQHLSLKEQYKEIDSRFLSWKGDTEQIDDVLVIGIEI